ncbi:tRNA-uridine aminocarboxypropyltransferase [Enterobacillus tribolii]|uniref:tRNA-uridine aminocarboxypropyltransferase n=1 Tax=Enterobacillus tribolii TaxID=1487935 RepID=A0A370QTG1_9GAMM|nr:tRNA-uridine aminocarboxypropyltransferase [Enterobacillus tribolii]MBW7983858.1 DTW domain-containing protein [Enterobacillus tribolii]RDK92223.1 hypothetical protein C8D90_104385 [Enterobacillus tribolii]
MLPNAVLRLREERLSRATRPFLARGCRVRRCQRCLLPQPQCLCETISPQAARSRFCLMMYDTEPMKPSNTGRLIADILPDTAAFQWSRTEEDEELQRLLADPAYQPYVVFPAAYAAPERVTSRLPVEEEPKTPLFILLDGTWPEARKMFRKSPYLDRFPVFSLDDDIVAQSYLLREAQRPEQHCTAEVAATLLMLAGDQAASQALHQHFTRFRRQYLLGKPHHRGDVTAESAGSA